jgi:hypothetical protein
MKRARDKNKPDRIMTNTILNAYDRIDPGPLLNEQHMAAFNPGVVSCVYRKPYLS